MKQTKLEGINEVRIGMKNKRFFYCIVTLFVTVFFNVMCSQESSKANVLETKEAVVDCQDRTPVLKVTNYKRSRRRKRKSDRPLVLSPEFLYKTQDIVSQSEQKTESKKENEFKPKRNRRRKRKSEFPLVLSPEYLQEIKASAEAKPEISPHRQRRLHRRKIVADKDNDEHKIADEQEQEVQEPVIVTQEPAAIEVEQEATITEAVDQALPESIQEQEDVESHDVQTTQEAMQTSVVKSKKMRRKKKEHVEKSAFPLVLSPEHLQKIKELTESKPEINPHRQRRLHRKKMVIMENISEKETNAYEKAATQDILTIDHSDQVINDLQPIKVVNQEQEIIQHQEVPKQEIVSSKDATLQESEQPILEQVCLIDEKQKRGIMVGRDYYSALLDKSQERHWAIPMSVYFDFTNKFFDPNGQAIDIGAATIGSGLKLKDIYLISRLADKNLMSIASVQPPTKARPVSQIGNSAFGTYANEIYLNLLADVEIGFNNFSQQETGFNLGLIYRFDITECGEIQLAFGGQIPFRASHVQASLQAINGSLYQPGFVQDKIIRQTTLAEFFLDYISVEDFIIREVLGKKGILFKSSQTKTGVGDLSLFGLVDFAGYTCWADGLQLGLNVVFPTGSRSSGTVLFEPEFSEGAYSFEPFANVIFTTPSPVFNPCFKIVGSIHRKEKVCNGIRLAQTASSTLSSGRAQVRDIAGLNAPAFFNQYFVGPFAGETDSTVSALADKAVTGMVKKGPKVLLSIGNYMFNVFNLGFRLGIFYDYVYKGKDKITVCTAGNFDTCAVTEKTQSRSHWLGVNLTYKFENMIELNIGTQNILAGTNIPRKNEVFASLILIF